MSLGTMFQARALAEAQKKEAGSPGWGKAKSVIMVYLQGGPSHLDLWDPKENVPDNVRSSFKPISTKIPGVNFTEWNELRLAVTPWIIVAPSRSGHSPA